MNDPDLERGLARSLERRAQRVSPRPNMEHLLSKLERRGSRQRRVLLGGVAAAFAIAGVIGYVAGQSDTSTESGVVVVNQGVPGAQPTGPAIEPENVDVATAEITQAFHDAFDGGTPDEVRRAAVQGSSMTEELRRETLASAQERGFTPAELNGISIEVLGTTFVDRTHAVVHFTLSIPDHGPVLVDQVAYAVFDSGRWQVSLRTACDLLSLSGLGQECPPRTP